MAEKTMKEILTDKQFQIFSDVYRRDYRRAQDALRIAHNREQEARNHAESWLKEINGLKAIALKHGFDITKEPSS
ncbi:hypothetical protein Ab1vBOLIVR2_gp31 [Agrobacterium phage OLIVR2]|uniref:Uncharacterized protein n=1 Tax=Agrobacterium phage OLIVR1 TaxID=2723769 RepID=A0A858MR22_9CAUD|nr:hypothetical protein [Xanthomonas campestris]YP_010107065.1 hypothetical protein KNU98_gp078 [Agrobacterium phage OLIVR1]QIW87334.1 hypothetical protein Ab1vBOLIVR2_gp31 [Agrobacterium phage OLIVR2]QIW87441.1 hypothetical protein Ab1vBOLIVR3_gp31 [Agrobacterium phage OLIVR3]MCF8861625.1 hypothetical protein [Xanthomonas campestris pv. campestris]QIW87226.1 hypothetical protein Ab1vBOLIVR1_gp31 [Agrobacterium phage OLIVR1]